MKRALVLLVVFLPAASLAQLTPGRHSFIPHVGPLLATGELLRNTATYPTPRPSEPFNPVVTDISLDPGIFAGGRYAYALTRRLAVEAEFDFGLSVLAIRQLEIKADARPEDKPQYETTTMDARIYQFGVNLTYFLGPWTRVHPFVTVGLGNHNLDLRQKGEVNPDPVRDRMFMGGLGVVLHANERLSVRMEVRDFMYSFRFDNQFIDPARSRLILFNRPDFINTTSTAGEKFQNDLACSLAFVVHPF